MRRFWTRNEMLHQDNHAPFVPEVGATVWILHRAWTVLVVYGAGTPNVHVEIEPAPTAEETAA